MWTTFGQRQTPRQVCNLLEFTRNTKRGISSPDFGSRVRGPNVTFTLAITLDGLGLTQHEFSGKADGDAIAGTVKVTPKDRPSETLPWRARRVERSDYFAPTGTAMFEQPAVR